MHEGAVGGGWRNQGTIVNRWKLSKHPPSPPMATVSPQKSPLLRSLLLSISRNPLTSRVDHPCCIARWDANCKMQALPFARRIPIHAVPRSHLRPGDCRRELEVMALTFPLRHRWDEGKRRAESLSNVFHASIVVWTNPFAILVVSFQWSFWSTNTRLRNEICTELLYEVKRGRVHVCKSRHTLRIPCEWPRGYVWQ